jgi:hypothetical protein
MTSAAMADSDAAAIWHRTCWHAATGMALLAADLIAVGVVRPDCDVDIVTDVLWPAMDFRNYDWLVPQRGGPVERFRLWHVDTVAAVVLSWSLDLDNGSGGGCGRSACRAGCDQRESRGREGGGVAASFG